METIGGFTVERILGQGGMGVVYLARSRGGRSVAVKVARPELAADPAFRARLRAEVAAARTVGGFHTAQVVDADPEGDPPWLATAYIPGPTLAQRLADDGPMPEPALRSLGAALAEALAAIHACGLVHRDLKPGNIILADDGPRVVDFGIAHAVAATRLTYLGTASGTAGFLAPEQVTGADVTPAADVFALGAVLATAAGREPFGEGGPLALLYRTVNEEPDLSVLPEGLRAVVADCLVKDPSLRPTPAELLDRLAGGVGVLAGDVALADAEAVPEAPAAPVASVPAGPPVPPTAPQDQFAWPPVAPTTLVPALADEDHAFVAIDDNGAVSIDSTGVLFQYRGAELELVWNQIAQINYALSQPGQRILIGVVLTNGHQAQQEIDARRKSERLRLIGDLEKALFLYAGGRHMPG